MKVKLVDTHTHVNFNAFKNDSKEVIERALEAGIWMINVGSQSSTSTRAVEMAENYQEGVYAAIGLHPTHLVKEKVEKEESGELIKYETRAEEFDENYYLELGKSKKTVAIGECGLDYFRLNGEIETKKEKQKETFMKHIELSHKIKKPLIIHCRDAPKESKLPLGQAHDDMLKILNLRKQNLNFPCGVMHFFTGTLEEAHKYIDLGLYISFSGVITFAKNYDELVENLPLERILIETDAPYVAPLPYRGKRNEPLYVAEVAKKISEIKKISFEEVARQTLENSRELFKI